MSGQYSEEAERYAAGCWEDSDALVQALEGYFIDEAIIRTLHAAIQHAEAVQPDFMRRPSEDALIILKNQLNTVVIRAAEGDR